MTAVLDFLDLNKNELRNARIQNVSTAPSSPVTGQLYYDTDDNILYFWNGTTWTSTAGGAGYTDEQTRDAIGTALVAGNNIDITVDDGSDTITIDVETLAQGDITNLVSDLALKAPLASPTFTGTVTLPATGSGATEAATKGYVDAAAAGIDWKASVRVATTVAGTLATSFENGDTIDGVALATGNRILVKNQAAGGENGIYVVAASGAPTRATDADANAEVTGGLAVFVEEGTVNADSAWVMTNDGAVTVGTTALVFTQFSGLGQVTVVAPIVKTGNQLSLDITSTTHAARIWTGALTGGATSEVVTHNLGTRDVIVQVVNNADPWDAVLVTWEASTTNTVTIRGGANLPASYRVVITG